MESLQIACTKPINPDTIYHGWLSWNHVLRGRCVRPQNVRGAKKMELLP